MKTLLPTCATILCLALTSDAAPAQDAKAPSGPAGLIQGFASPPTWARMWTDWFWINDNVDKQIGHGFAGATMADGRIYTAGEFHDDTVITALDMDGHLQWQAENGKGRATARPAGARCTPTIDGTRLYHENAGGQLVGSEAKTGNHVWGYPQHLLPLRDGRLLMSYGYRRPPCGVRACLSSDNGKTWDLDNEIILRMDGGTPEGQPVKVIDKDLGYPVSVQLGDGRIFTVYYFNTGGANCFIAGTFWDLPGTEGQGAKSNGGMPTK